MSKVSISALSKLAPIQELAAMDPASFAPYKSATHGEINLNGSDLEDMDLRERYAAIQGMEKAVEGYEGTDDTELAGRVTAIQTIIRFVRSTLTVTDLLKEENPDPALVKAVLSSYDVDRSNPSKTASYFRDAIYTRGWMTCVPSTFEELDEVAPTALSDLLMSMEIEDYTEYADLMKRLAKIYGEELELQRAFDVVATAHDAWVDGNESALRSITPSILRLAGENIEYEVIDGVRYICAEIEGDVVRMKDDDQTGIEEGQFLFNDDAAPSDPPEIKSAELQIFTAHVKSNGAFSADYCKLKDRFEERFPNHCIDGRYNQDLEGDDIDTSMPGSLIQMLEPLHRQFVTANQTLSAMMATPSATA